MKLISFANLDALNAALIERVSITAKQALARKGFFTFVLAGGNTPKGFYQALAQTPQDWQNWQLIYGDERYLPLNATERNHQMVLETFLANTTIPAKNHHIVPFTGHIEADATRYSEQITALLPVDFALLGIGEDGHTASLFPKHTEVNAIAHAVYQAPKPPATRISLSYTTLQQSQTLVYLSKGKDKLSVIQQGLADLAQGKTDLMPFCRVQAQNVTEIFYTE